MAVRILGQEIPLSTGWYALLAYLVAVRLLRYRTRNSLLRNYACKTSSSLKDMTNQEAFEIQRKLASQEFPFTYEKSLQFALFRTYGIPTISKLLVATKQLSTAQYAGKRYSDTEVLIQEFMGNAPEAPRTLDAIARMNHIHSKYQAKGLISNDDMLYTLSMFALEPQRWIARYEWRALTEIEICALGVFWKAQGDAMAIDMSPLDQYAASGSVSEDGLAWFEALDAWSEAYEQRAMVPAVSNKTTADETVTILLYDVPKAMHGLGKQAVSALMDERLRKAMMYAPPSAVVETIVKSALKIRRVLLKYLALPRPYVFRFRGIEDEPDANGRLHLRYYTAEPFYVKDSLYNRYGPLAWVKWAIGNPFPGKSFKPEGYLIPEVGPRSYEGKGLKEQEAGVERLRGMNRGGCPFKI